MTQTGGLLGTESSAATFLELPLAPEQSGDAL